MWLSSHISIAKVENELVPDFELSRNSDEAKKNKMGPLVYVGCNPEFPVSSWQGADGQSVMSSCQHTLAIGVSKAFYRVAAEFCEAAQLCGLSWVWVPWPGCS